MKIVFTAKGTDWDSPMDPRFGRTEFFLIYDEDADSLESFDNRDVAEEAHGAGPRTAQRLAGFNADILVTGNGPGGNAAVALGESTRIYVGAGEMSVREAYRAYKAGSLKQLA